MSAEGIPGDFGSDGVVHPLQGVPEGLRRATQRLQFPPSYVVVGVYRLFTDKTLSVPAWDKCRHGAVRGATVALTWVRVQDAFAWHVPDILRRRSSRSSCRENL